MVTCCVDNDTTVKRCRLGVLNLYASLIELPCSHEQGIRQTDRLLEGDIVTVTVFRGNCHIFGRVFRRDFRFYSSAGTTCVNPVKE